jgi:hypothetical protein
VGLRKFLEKIEIAKRFIEIFTAGCPLCDETVKLVRELAYDHGDI